MLLHDEFTGLLKSDLILCEITYRKFKLYCSSSKKIKLLQFDITVANIYSEFTVDK